MKTIKNIVIVCDYTYIEGGATKVAIESAVFLSRQYNVIFFGGCGIPCKELKESEIKVVSLHMSDLLNNQNKVSAITNGIYNKKAAKAIKKILVNLNSEETIVHFHTWTKVLSCSVFMATRKLGFKSVLTMHDYFSVCPNGGFYNYKNCEICRKIPMSFECITCNCDKRSFPQKIWRVFRQIGINRYVTKNKNLNLIYISEFSFLIVEKYLSGHNVYYVKNPYDLGEEIIYNAEKQKNYLFLGRVSEEKGADVFCEAFSRLISENKIHGEAIVVGSGEQQKKLEENYTLIKFLGWKNKTEITQIISTTRALIFPSKWYETAGLTPIEFMSHGVPCIVADSCAATEYFENGRTGLFFKNKSVEDLIKMVLFAEDNDNWIKIAKELRDTFNRKDYSEEKHIKDLVIVYNTIINN